MNREEYLIETEKTEFDEKKGYCPKVLDIWHSMGHMECDNSTMMYTKGTLLRIMVPSNRKAQLSDRLIYVLETYQVDNKSKLPIDWSIVSVDNVEDMYCAVDGIVVPYFLVLKSKWRSDFVPTQGFIPFEDQQDIIDNGEVIIEDDELEIILTDIGFPFLSFADIEYSKAQICRTCIKPAMQRFFTYFPKVVEESGTGVPKGGEFLVKFPEGAYACIPYYTTPGGGNIGIGGSRNPFMFYGEQVMSGSRGFGFGGGGMGKGIRYIGKQQPGYVGMEQRNAWLDNLAVQQGFLNYFRREKYTRKRIDGTLYAYGFSTIGGHLNFKWLCGSKDWQEIPFELLEPVARPMAKSAVLLQVGMLRQLVKSDIAGQLDATVLTNQRKEYEDWLQPIIKSVGVSGQFAIGRGGG